MISGIIFDFFGVISSEVAPIWFGDRFPEEEAGRLKQEYLEPADRGDVSSAALFASLSALSGEPAEEIERDFNSLAVIKRDTVELIEKLKERYRVALLSNAMGDWLSGILEREDLYRLFDEMIISSEVRLTKPSPEIYKLLISRLGIAPSEAVFLDDNPTNAEAARAVGMQAIVFSSAAEAARELRKLGVEI